MLKYDVGEADDTCDEGEYLYLLISPVPQTLTSGNTADSVGGGQRS